MGKYFIVILIDKQKATCQNSMSSLSLKKTQQSRNGMDLYLIKSIY